MESFPLYLISRARVLMHKKSLKNPLKNTKNAFKKYILQGNALKK